jgi:glycosyltransferase involved in cell wall biosynthesis
MKKHVPLRIGLLSYRSNPNSGGQGVYIKNLSRALKDMGHFVEVISGPPGLKLDSDIPVFRLPCLDLYNPNDPFRVPTLMELSNPINLIEWLGVSTMGFPEPFTFGIRAYLFLRNKRHKYDIIHDNQSLSYGIWAIRKFVPTIATIHHPITVDRDIEIKTASSVRNKMKQMRWYSFIGMQKQVARRMQSIITVSKSAKDDISADFKIHPDKFNIIPNGVDTHLFFPMPDIPREKDRIIVTNSADTPLKGLSHLLRAVAQISQKRRIRLIVIGIPKKKSGVVRLIKELDIGSLVTFTGRINHQQFVREYAKATIAVVPSVYEGFGLPVGEAMACGVPVISTSGGALPEVVGNAGVIVPPANSDELAKAIISLLDNPDRANSLAQAGYKRVQDHFTWERAAEKTIEVYKEAISDYSRL